MNVRFEMLEGSVKMLTDFLKKIAGYHKSKRMLLESQQAVLHDIQIRVQDIQDRMYDNLDKSTDTRIRVQDIQDRIYDNLDKSTDTQIRVQDIQDRVYDVLWQQKTSNHQREMMFWEIYKLPGESLVDTKCRFFHTIPSATGTQRKSQRLLAQLLKEICEVCEKMTCPTGWILEP